MTKFKHRFNQGDNQGRRLRLLQTSHRDRFCKLAQTSRDALRIFDVPSVNWGTYRQELFRRLRDHKTWSTARLIKHAMNYTPSASVSPNQQNMESAWCALLEGCALRFVLRPNHLVLDFISPLQPILAECDTLIVGVQVRMGDKFSMTKLEMERAGVNTAYDARIPPKSVNLFWRAAELVGERLSRRKHKIRYFISSDSAEVMQEAEVRVFLLAQRRQTCAQLCTSLR
mmetsp:Transcript_35405/g.86969  ORF Transcript_35405/g.86969 Transcript_35405/m.86969 type:complete len:228 (-) Transcript_35405:567-1250(-)